MLPSNGYAPPLPSEVVFPICAGFYNFFLYFAGINGFFICLKEMPKAKKDVSRAFDLSMETIHKDRIQRFINASWALMPLNPSVALHIAKTLFY